jgi:hypothetical protein
MDGCDGKGGGGGWPTGATTMDGWDGKYGGGGGDKPPWVVQGMVKPLGWKEVSQELRAGWPRTGLAL